ncbi:hypothetical protein NVIE_1190 [Nitrososphaera viennensis EN76]|uniref:Uncharacterized protein n=1 Tax=Nitrososphaera viennensis EN76 TaxID=926571 RepID=A0A060HQI2_9ARCH|nr:hypothetical protein NVIE_1190 [Nitrososphaera viennensis EN76]
MPKLVGSKAPSPKPQERQVPMENSTVLHMPMVVVRGNYLISKNENCW